MSITEIAIELGVSKETVMKMTMAQLDMALGSIVTIVSMN